MEPHTLVRAGWVGAVCGASALGTLDLLVGGAPVMGEGCGWSRRAHRPPGSGGGGVPDSVPTGELAAAAAVFGSLAAVVGAGKEIGRAGIRL